MEQLRPTQSAPTIAPKEVDITNIVMPNSQSPRTPETKTKEFKVDDMKEQPSTIKIDIFGGDKPNDFIKNVTEPARTASTSSEPAYINPTPGGSTTPMAGTAPPKTKEEIAGSMRTLIAIVDYVMSFIGLMLSGKGTQTVYTADAQQKKLLETALVDYFYEKKINMSAGWALFLAILGAYGFMLAGALKDCYERIVAKRKAKANGQTEPQAQPQVTYSPPSAPRPQQQRPPQTASVPKQDMQHYADIKPHVTAPRPPAPQLKTETIYAEKNGVMEPQQVPIAPTTFKSTWYNPDPNITAANRDELLKYVAAGIYPMYKTNEQNKQKRLVKYNNDGTPRLVGKLPKRNKAR